MPDNTTFFDSNMGNLFVQPGGPMEAIYPMGCHDLGDISQSEGDITERRCPDPSGPGKWMVVLSSVGQPERGTSSVTTYLGKVKDWLERQGNEPFTLYVQHAHTGRKDQFLNYERGEVMRGCRITSRTRSGLVAREGSDAAEQSFEFSFDATTPYYPLALANQAVAATTPFLCICFSADGQVGVAGAAAGTGAMADVAYTRDGGLNWKLAAVQPFANDEDIAAVALLPLAPRQYRILALLGTTNAGPMTVAYSDNWGASWTTVSVGGGNGNFGRGPKALVAVDYANIYVVGDDGDLFKSANGGASYTEISLTSVQPLLGAHFKDVNTGIVVGEVNTILRTMNGGTSWTTIPGPADQAAANVTAGLVFDQYRIMVGYDDGEVWYTDDAGDSWVQVAFSFPTGFSSGTIADMHAVDDHCIAIALTWETDGSDIFSTLYRTICGGTYWDSWTTDEFTDQGVGGVWLTGYDAIHAVGGIIDTNGSIFLLSD